MKSSKKVAGRINSDSRNARGSAGRALSGIPGYSRNRKNDHNTALKCTKQGSQGLTGPFGKIDNSRGPK